MDSYVIAGIVFVFAFGGALLGMLLRGVLPESHMTHESKEVIRLGTGLVATMAALVLGLLVASAQSSFQAERSGFQELATNLILLDRTLMRYGPDAREARQTVRRATSGVIERLWPTNGSNSSGLAAPEITADGSAIYAAIRDLAPTNESERAAQAQALQLGTELAKTRWLLSEADADTLSIPFLLVLTFWLFVLFMSFGLFAPRNPTVIAALLVSALSVSGAILLIVDLSQPFDGLIHIPKTPLTNALAQMGE